MAFKLPENFQKITLQSIFDAAWAAFIVGDGQPARTANGCVYLAKNGNKCAVGLRIPDGHPAQQSGGDFGQIASEYPELFDISVLEQLDKLYPFQKRLHDTLSMWDSKTEEGQWLYPKNTMRAAYVLVAKSYGLTVPTDQAV